MQIVELGDYSMVIMKDSTDPFRFSVGAVYRTAKKYKHHIYVTKLKETVSQEANDCIYTAGRLILFFKDHVYPEFHLHDEVLLDF